MQARSGEQTLGCMLVGHDWSLLCSCWCGLHSAITAGAATAVDLPPGALHSTCFVTGFTKRRSTSLLATRSCVAPESAASSVSMLGSGRWAPCCSAAGAAVSVPNALLLGISLLQRHGSSCPEDVTSAAYYIMGCQQAATVLATLDAAAYSKLRSLCCHIGRKSVGARDTMPSISTHGNTLTEESLLHIGQPHRCWLSPPSSRDGGPVAASPDTSSRNNPGVLVQPSEAAGTSAQRSNRMRVGSSEHGVLSSFISCGSATGGSTASSRGAMAVSPPSSAIGCANAGTCHWQSLHVKAPDSLAVRPAPAAAQIIRHGPHLWEWSLKARSGAQPLAVRPQFLRAHVQEFVIMHASACHGSSIEIQRTRAPRSLLCRCRRHVQPRLHAADCCDCHARLIDGAQLQNLVCDGAGIAAAHGLPPSL